MSTQYMYSQLLGAVEKYIDKRLLDILASYNQTDVDLTAFETINMEKYSGNAPIDHVLFRKFLRQFDPADIENNLAKNKQDKVDSLLGTTDKSVVGSINEVLALVKTLGSGTAEKEVVEVAGLPELYALPNPTDGVVYIVRSTGELYIYDDKNSEFINVTNKPVDNTFYVNDITELLDYPYDQTGVFAVIEAKKAGSLTKTTSYTLVVSSAKIGTATIYIPVLSDKNGWAETKTVGGTRKWEWHKYAYQNDIVRLETLIAAAL